MAAIEVMGLELNRALSEYVQEEFGIETYQGFITAPRRSARSPSSRRSRVGSQI